MEPAGHEALFPWVERTLGGRVVRRERQGERRSGGRPAWFIDVERGGEIVRCYARMQRGDEQVGGFTLEREHAVLCGLHRGGVLVPRVYGLCPDPKGILMERLRGDFDYSAIVDPERRRRLGASFVAELAKLHALDVRPFAELGLAVPASAEDFALADLERWERAYRASAREPVPLAAFACRWLRRNVPPAPARPSLLQGDTGPGQFMFEGDRLTGIIDWEFAHVGDAMLDLAQIRCRDFYNPGADLGEWFRLYAELAGAPIDVGKLRYYTVKAMLITPLALAGVVQRLGPHMDHAEWIAQDVAYQRATAEALAEAIGVDLDPPSLPEPAPTPWAGLFDLLEADLREEQMPAQGDGFLRYRLGLDLRLLRILRNADSRGRELAAQDRDEMAALLGARPASVAEGQRALDALVAAAGPERDAELVRYFHRHALREQALVAGALGAGEGARLAPLDLAAPEARRAGGIGA
jgi:aminoglycoside phosphotransferase (APT) family kinase protein